MQCEWTACDEQGEYPAPKPNALGGGRFHFCLAHVRLYNKNWNFFDNMGMDPIQVAEFEKSALHGHRPTHRRDAFLNTSTMTAEQFKRRIYESFYKPQESKHYQSNHFTSNTPHEPLQEAFKILGVDIGTSWDKVKKRYKMLAKRYHPDINGQDGAERFKQISHAYGQLKTFYSQS